MICIPTQERGNELKVRVEKQVETRVKTPDQVMSLLANQPTLTLAEIAAYLGKSPSTIERAVAKLKQQKRLAFHGPKKGGIGRC
ncbi:hypothetical protein BZG81_10925 [Salinivibrio sp. MA607]|nr:hypothetical protein BZG81_10925 [Salinivibrio sp. MA607]